MFLLKETMEGHLGAPYLANDREIGVIFRKFISDFPFTLGIVLK